MTEDEQKLLGVEDDEIIKYNQEFKLFNTSDYIGKSKGLSLNYDKDMKIELFKQSGEGEKELIDTFIVDDITKQYEAEIEYLKREHKKEAEDKKKRDEKDKKDKKKKDKKDKKKEEDMTEEEKTAAAEEEKKEKEEEEAAAKAEAEKAKEEPEEEFIPPKPKTRISIEFSRSGFM